MLWIIELMWFSHLKTKRRFFRQSGMSSLAFLYLIKLSKSDRDALLKVDDGRKPIRPKSHRTGNPQQ